MAAVAAFGTVSALVNDVHAAVVINEIYGGGGFAVNGTLPASAFNRDFVELFNNGTEAVNISGYVFRYGSAASTSVGPTLVGTLGGTIADGTILPVGGSFLIAGGSATNTNGATLPVINLSTAVDLSGTSGRVALFASTSATEAIDFVGYGSATAFETAPATGFAGTNASGVTSLNRTGGLDTNNNLTDFTFAAPTPPVPEPASLGLAAAAGALLIGRRRR